MSKPRLVVIGNGMAGIRTLEELLAIAPGHYDITVFGAEPHPNYNRILLSPVLAGEQTFNDIVLNSLDRYKEDGRRLLSHATGEQGAGVNINNRSCDHTTPLAPGRRRKAAYCRAF